VFRIRSRVATRRETGGCDCGPLLEENYIQLVGSLSCQFLYLCISLYNIYCETFRMVGERYYSQQYSLVEPNPDGSHVALDQLEDHSYQGYGPHSQASPPGHDQFDDSQSYQKPQPRPNRRRKFLICGGVAALVLVIALAVGLGVGLTVGNKYDYTPSFAHVTNTAAFTNGGATHNSPWDTNDGIGAGKDEYTYYSGNWTNFPNASDWVSFSDMWSGNLHTLQTSCETLGDGSNNS